MHMPVDEGNPKIALQKTSGLKCLDHFETPGTITTEGILELKHFPDLSLVGFGLVIRT